MGCVFSAFMSQVAVRAWISSGPPLERVKRPSVKPSKKSGKISPCFGLLDLIQLMVPRGVSHAAPKPSRSVLDIAVQTLVTVSWSVSALCCVRIAILHMCLEV